MVELLWYQIISPILIYQLATNKANSDDFLIVYSFEGAHGDNNSKHHMLKINRSHIAMLKVLELVPSLTTEKQVWNVCDDLH